MSPLVRMPPSAMTGTPAGSAALTALKIAVICGTPTPVTTRVVQIEPGPMPAFTASAPASIKSAAPSSVATLPAITSMSCLALMARIVSMTFRLWPWAESTTSTSTSAPINASARSSWLTPTAAPDRSRPRASRQERGYCWSLEISRIVISPVSRPC